MIYFFWNKNQCQISSRAKKILKKEIIFSVSFIQPPPHTEHHPSLINIKLQNNFADFSMLPPGKSNYLLIVKLLMKMDMKCLFGE